MLKKKNPIQLKETLLKVFIFIPSIEILSFLLIFPVINPPSHKQPNKFGNSFAKIICPLKKNKYLFDLPLFIKEKLSFIGIDKIGDVHLDTYINKQFFSHRRAIHKKINNKNITGRQISIIGLI